MGRSSIRGLDSWNRWVDNISDEVETEIKEAIEEFGYRIEADAKRLVPVDTGHLRRSINTSFEDGGLTAYIGTNVEYSLAVEFGTSRMGARPYLSPAYNKWKVRFKDKLIEITNGVGD